MSSLWVWDHVLLGTDPHFPIVDALTILTAVAARTNKIRLGTGVLVLPLRNPLLLAKQIATLDLLSDGRFELGAASGWYKREFDAVGVPFNQRGRIMDRNLDIMIRLWTEPAVTAEIPPYNMRQAVMYPKPRSKPHPTLLIGGYVDAVLKRAGQKSDGWLTYFYTPDSFVRSWKKVCDYAGTAGRDPSVLHSCNQLPIMIGPSRQAVQEKMMEWLHTEWDFAGWSESTPTAPSWERPPNAWTSCASTSRWVRSASCWCLIGTSASRSLRSPARFCRISGSSDRAARQGGGNRVSIRTTENTAARTLQAYDLQEVLSHAAADAAFAAISACPLYAPTPLRRLDRVAASSRVGNVWYKDEASRFGLGSFKALGGAFAVARLLQRRLAERLDREVALPELVQGGLREHTQQITVTCATDGNHGRSVAAGARIFGCRCVIFLHAEVSQGREDAIRAFGADIVRITGNYDESVLAASRAADQKRLGGCL